MTPIPTASSAMKMVRGPTVKSPSLSNAFPCVLCLVAAIIPPNQGFERRHERWAVLLQLIQVADRQFFELGFAACGEMNQYLPPVRRRARPGDETAVH